MDASDAGDGVDRLVEGDDVAERAKRARRDLEHRLAPEPPPFRSVQDRVQRRHRHLAAAAVIVVLAVVGGTLASLDGGTDSQVAATQLIRSDRPRDKGDPGAIPAAVEADTAFAADLYRQLATTEKGNFFLSPHSISMAMAMTLAGADGETRAQLEKALRLTIPEPAFHDAINALDQALTAPRTVDPTEGDADPLHLDTANSLWGQSGYPFRDQFLDRIAGSYDAGMNVTDFEKEAEASRRAINAWVAAETGNRIKELIPEGVIDEMTRLVLVNTITFKAGWVSEFEKAKPGSFTTADGKEVSAPMMPGGKGSAASGDGWTSVSIPYVGGAQMVVIMPDDLEAFEPTLTPEVLEAAARGDGEAAVTLPKFSVTSELDLKATLQSLGITDAFDDSKADLSRIDGSRGLYVSDVVHQATITVDEKGTDAAAATAVVIGAVSAPPTIVIDKPFLFVIRDDATGAILFTGRVTDPTA